MSSKTYDNYCFDEELVKYVASLFESYRYRISTVWDLLTKEAPPKTPQSRPNPTSILQVGTGGAEESSTVGSGRSMSILESFDDLRQPAAPRQKWERPVIPTVPFLNSEPLTERPVTEGGDRSNAEASLWIKESGRFGDLGACWKAWNNLISEGGIPNEITLGCMVDALVSNREVRQAESLVNQWKDKIRPNTVVYSTLIHGWAKQNDAKRAMSIFKQMQQENVACNAVTYNCMIHACVRSGDLQGSLELLGAMKRNPSLRPDKFTYSTIIKGYCGQGDIQNALVMFQEMLGENLAPDLVIYNTLLDGCVKTRQNYVCDDLLSDMLRKWRINPNSYTLSILIKRFGRQGDLMKAFELVEELPRKYGFRANAHVWTCLISACVAHGRLETAECVFASMSGDRGKARELLETNSEFESAHDSHLVKRALSVASLCPPDAKTYETLVQGYLRFNEVRKALELMRKATEKFRGELNPRCVSQVAQSAAQYGLDISVLMKQQPRG